MALAPGTRLGPYEIVGPVGAGGMGEVYRARDERLGRDVAIKVIPGEVASDPNRLRRFEHEARAAGALNQPNVLTVHDIGTHEGAPYLVSELLDGETLRDRLSHGPLPPRKAAAWAARIARGLAAAHERGIIHRDLKPENVFVTRDEQVKILDFGLAKLTPAAEPGPAEDVPTRTVAALTGPGVVLGTVGYMAPEQVRGEEADARSDIFALGTLLHEMLTGERAFRGDSAVDTMHAILRSEPAALERPDGGVPPALARVTARCLEKEPVRRYQSAGDLAFQLELLSEATSLSGSSLSAAGLAAPGSIRAPAAWRRVALAAALLVVGALAGLAAGWLLREAPAPPPPVKVTPLTYSGTDRAPVVSPDGRTLAFVSTRDGRPRLWLQRFPGGDEVALTEMPALGPRFSPDGSELLFGSTGALWRISALGGEPRKIVDGPAVGDWSPRDDRIALVRNSPEGGSLYTVGIDGSDERRLYFLPDRALLPPRWAPDGRTIALSPISPGSNLLQQSLILVDADSGDTREVALPFPGGQAVAYAWSGDGSALVYSQCLARTLLGGQFHLVWLDIDSGRGRELALHPSMLVFLDVAGDGAVVAENDSPTSRLAELSLEEATSPGRAAGSPRRLTRGRALDRQPVYRPGDDGWVTFSSNRGGNLDIWAVSRENGAVRRLTDHPAVDWDPSYSPDGSRLLFSSDRSGNFEIWTAEADGRDPHQLSGDGFDAENPVMSPDGAWVVYNSSRPDAPGLWKMRADGTEATRVVEGLVAFPEISPDGRYLLFARMRPTSATIHAVRLDDGEPVFETLCEPGSPPPFFVAAARLRWMPDGRIAFLCAGRDSELGVYVQDFEPGRDTASTRRKLAESSSTPLVESFGISPDGRRITLSEADYDQSVLLFENLPLVERPRR